MRKINAETPKPPTSIRLLTFCLSQYSALMKVVTNQKFWYLVAHTPNPHSVRGRRSGLVDRSTIRLGPCKNPSSRCIPLGTRLPQTTQTRKLTPRHNLLEKTSLQSERIHFSLKTRSSLQVCAHEDTLLDVRVTNMSCVGSIAFLQNKFRRPPMLGARRS